jgi:fluoroquinolone resistance protein
MVKQNKFTDNVPTQSFENIQLGGDVTDFDQCIFLNSNFVNFDFTGYEFTDCTFKTCNFSNAVFDRITLVRVKFINCKLIGVDFSKCSKFNFSISFQDSLLDYAFFFKNNLKGTIFKQCSIKEATFAECDLTLAGFEDCDLEKTIFERNNLQQCNFRSANNYRINPIENKIKGAVFSYPGLIGLLDYFQIEVADF